MFAANKTKTMINNYKDHHLPSLLHAIEIGSSPSARHSRLTWEHLILDKGGGNHPVYHHHGNYQDDNHHHYHHYHIQNHPDVDLLPLMS